MTFLPSRCCTPTPMSVFFGVFARPEVRIAPFSMGRRGVYGLLSSKFASIQIHVVAVFERLNMF